MIVRMFQPRFAPLVESGEKRQTIRKTPKRMPKVGDELSLRCWTGKPYRSKQRELLKTKVKAVTPIRIRHTGIDLDERQLSDDEVEALAVADGFEEFHEMVNWFYDTHALPFEGILIEWEVPS